jgi:predicted enzyme related to lactoylglutathione lyase
MGPMDVLDAGRWALLSDPQGGTFGVFKPPPAP